MKLLSKTSLTNSILPSAGETTMFDLFGTVRSGSRKKFSVKMVRNAESNKSGTRIKLLSKKIVIAIRTKTKMNIIPIVL
jgi:hypothetical protein